MPFTPKLLDGAGKERWDSFVEAQALGTVYHHSLWHASIEKTYGYSTYYLLREDSGKISAGLPLAVCKSPLGSKRLISYPFSDVCGPLAENDTDAADLMRAAVELRKTLPADSVELREFQTNGLDGATPEYYGFVLDLDRPEESVYKSFHKDCIRRAIKKAIRCGVAVTEGRSIEDMRAYYGLHLKTRRRQGVPSQPMSFFENLWEKLYPKGMLTLLFAECGGIKIAGLVLLKHKKTAYYKYGASDERFFRFCPNQILMWSAIKNAIIEGFERFDFGRTYSGDASLIEYKSRWGAHKIPMRYIRVPASKKHIAAEGKLIARMAGGILKKMPLFSIRMIGGSFYRFLA